MAQGRGTYVRIGQEARPVITKNQKGNPTITQELLEQTWLDASDVKRAAEHPTHLFAFRPDQFDRLVTHGYETFKCNELLFQQTPPH